MEKPTVLITGANRGIGLEIARQLGKRGFIVFLGLRNPATAAAALAQLEADRIDATWITLDVAEEASIRRAFEEVSRRTSRLDVLINNAAVLLEESVGILEAGTPALMQSLTTNALGPLWMVQTFLPLLGPGSRVVNVSSGAGSLTDAATGYAPVYSISKTTLNAVTRQLAFALQAQQISVNAVCPGWVRTDMGGSSAPRSVAKGAETLVWLATDAPAELTGRFFRDKKEIPW